MTIALVLHGGAGLISRASLTPDRESACRGVLAAALDAGVRALGDGAQALDVVVDAVVSMEDSPLFNAGRGSVLTAAGTVEMDASVMEGRQRAAGAVAALTGVRNPIRAARAVMARSPHLLLVGVGGEAFAVEQGLELRPPGWFVTALRQAQLDQLRAAGRVDLDHGGTRGTVGAVALDDHGVLAAATSTGGMTNAAPGRVGDSALIGAGTWAWDQTCAVSCTGHGERLIQVHAAARVSDLMELAGLSLEEAASRVIHQELAALGGSGGLIAVDRAGRVAMPFNSGGMFRAWRAGDGAQGIAIWDESTA